MLTKNDIYYYNAVYQYLHMLNMLLVPTPSQPSPHCHIVPCQVQNLSCMVWPVWLGMVFGAPAGAVGMGDVSKSKTTGQA